MAGKYQLHTTFPLSLQPPTETRSFMRHFCSKPAQAGICLSQHDATSDRLLKGTIVLTEILNNLTAPQRMASKLMYMYKHLKQYPVYSDDCTVEVLASKVASTRPYSGK